MSWHLEGMWVSLAGRRRRYLKWTGIQSVWNRYCATFPAFEADLGVNFDTRYPGTYDTGEGERPTADGPPSTSHGGGDEVAICFVSDTP